MALTVSLQSQIIYSIRPQQLARVETHLKPERYPVIRSDVAGNILAVVALDAEPRLAHTLFLLMLINKAPRVAHLRYNCRKRFCYKKCERDWRLLHAAP